MPKGVIWSLVIIGALLVFRLLTSDTQAHLTLQQQGQQIVPLWSLFVTAAIWSPVIIVLVVCVKRYRESGGDWTYLLPLAIISVFYGGVWAWFGYFGDHGAFLLWPVIVIIVLAVLLTIYCIDDYKKRKAYRETLMKNPPTEFDHGPANPEDFKDW